jgi:replicative DNA helicase
LVAQTAAVGEQKMKTVSLDAEKAVIGAIFIGGEKTYNQVSSIIEVSDFFAAEHRVVFDAFGKSIEQKTSIDPVSIGQLIPSDNLLSIGGMTFISELCTAAFSKANAVSYAEIVLDKSKLRSLTKAATSILEMAGGEESTGEKIAKAQEIVSDIAKTQKTEDKDSSQASKEFVLWLKREESELKSGFFDAYTGGLFPGLIVIAAGTGQGKSTLAMNIAYNLRDKNIAYYSLEMPAAQIIGRMVSSDSGLQYSRIRDKKLEGDQWSILTNSVGKIRNSKIRFIDKGVHINQICAHARAMKNNHGLDLIIVDYIQLVTADGQNREREVATITRKLKSLSMDLNIPVVALAQLSRDHEKRPNPRPTLRDLRESGAIEQDSDLVLFLYDESKYNDKTTNAGLTELYSGKFRHGENFSITLDQHLANYRFAVSKAFIERKSARVLKL